jgi:hypothetical protein
MLEHILCGVLDLKVVIKNMSASGRNSVNNVEAYNLDCREL